MENILELQQVSKTFPKSNFTLEDVTIFPTVWGYFGICGRKRSRKNYDDWLYFEYNQKRQWNDKAVWTRNAGRRYELA